MGAARPWVMVMWAASRFGRSEAASRSASRRTGIALAVAVALHVLVVVFAGYLIDPPSVEIEDRIEPRIVQIAPPPPPRLDDGRFAEAPSTILPRFRPRHVLPRGTFMELTRPMGSPAEALFRYWCSNRPDTIELTGRNCPSDVVMTGLAALPQRSVFGDDDAGVLLGPADRGYTIDEAAARRGWVRPRPQPGYDPAKPERIHGDKASEVYGDMPWDQKPGR